MLSQPAFEEAIYMWRGQPPREARGITPGYRPNTSVVSLTLEDTPVRLRPGGEPEDTEWLVGG